MSGDPSASNGHVAPNVPASEPTPSSSPPPPPSAADPSATTPLGLNRQELVRLLIQSMDSLGYSKSARQLEAEAGIEAMSYQIKRLRNSVLNGHWDTIEQILDHKFIKNVFKSDKDEKLARFVIYEQKFLELLESRKTAEALYCLRNNLTQLSSFLDCKLFHKLPLLCLCATPSEVREHAAWPGTGYVSRSTVLKKLYKYIPSYYLLQENRLENLLLQTINIQKKKTMYPYTRQKRISLLEDMEHCTDCVPTCKLFKLYAHTDEVWYVRFSHSGHFLASASHDSTIIIWNIKSLMQHHSSSRNRSGYLLDDDDGDDNFQSNGSSSMIITNNGNNGHSKHNRNRHRSKRRNRRQRRMMRDDDDNGDDDNNNNTNNNNNRSRNNDLVVDEDDDYLVHEDNDDDDNNNNDEGDNDDDDDDGDDDEDDDDDADDLDDEEINIRDERFIHKKLEGHTNTICCLSWSPKNERDGGKSDERLLSCGQDKKIKLWNVASGECMRTFEGHSKEVSSCVWLPDGEHFISGSYDGKILEWDSRTGNINHRYEARAYVNDMLLSRDGKLLFATCSDKSVQVFSTESKAEVFVFFEGASIPAMHLASDDQHLMVLINSQENPDIKDPEVHVWKVKLGNTTGGAAQSKIVQKFKGFKQSRYVIRGCFAGFENMFIICGSEDGLVYIWERSSGDLIAKLKGHTGTVNTVAVSEADENLFASGSDDKCIILWGVRQQRAS